MSELATGLAESSNQSTHDTQPATPDAALDAVFNAPAEGSDPSGTSTQTDPTPDASAATTVQPPVTTEAKAQTTGEKGPIPYDRHEAALANARTKAREDAIAEHRDALEIVQRLKTDFTGTLAQLFEEGTGDPRFAEQLTSRAAAILSARNKAAKADAEPEPDAVMRYEDGTTEPSYSPGQLRKLVEWRERQSERRLLEQFKPLQELQERFQQVEQKQRDLKEIAQVVSTRWAEWESMPFLKENIEPIKQRQAQIYSEMEARASESGQPFDVHNAPFQALSLAYREIVNAQVLPKLQTQQTEALVAAAARKRAGSASDPAASAPAQPRTPRTVDEALDQVFSTVSV